MQQHRQAHKPHRYLALLALTWVSVVGAQTQAPSAMWEEASYELLFHQGTTRIVDVKIEANATTDFHQHQFATVYVVIQDALTSIEPKDGDPAPLQRRDYLPPGALVDRENYAVASAHHRVKNVDSRALHLIAIVNERGPAERTIRPVNTALLNNLWFAEQRLRLGPNELGTPLQLEHDAVLVQFDDGASHVWEDGNRHSHKEKAGAFSWHPAGSAFRIANGLPTTREFVLISIRR